MTDSSPVKYEVLTRKEAEGFSTGSKPSSVTEVTSTSVMVNVPTKKGLKSVPYTTIPSEYVLYGRKNNVRIVEASPSSGVLAWVKRMAGVKERQIGFVQPEPGEEDARAELVVVEQDRIPIGNGSYSYMGDGSVMGTDGERPLVEEVVRSRPDNFPTI